MKYFFDTSVLVPSLLEDHVHHEESLAVFLKADKKHSGCAAHSLAEVYSTLTRLPRKQRISGEQAMLFLDSMRERLTFIALTASEYWSVIADAAESGVLGGTVYDAILARCALKAEADIIYTWNISHFLQLGPEVAARIRTPRS